LVSPETPRENAGDSLVDAATDDVTRYSASEAGDGLLSLKADDGGPSGLLIASLVMLVAGVGLFAARWAARRTRSA
jgi:hypothetical protein